MQSLNPQVSIVTPTYNRAHQILRAWQSLKNQSLESFQWIVVDDGSDDSTANVIRDIDDPRITYIYQQNMGVNAARNRGKKKLAPLLLCFWIAMKSCMMMILWLNW